MSSDTEAALEQAIMAHCLATDGIDEGSVIVGWTLVGEAIDPSRDIGTVRIFHTQNQTLDPILELGLLTTRQDDVRAQCARDDDAE